MRTRFILSFIAALFMQFTTVSADNYTDGLMKLMNSDAMGLYTKSFEQMSQMPNVNAGYIQGQFKTDVVEWLAGHYRKNMSEKEFGDMISFFMQAHVQYTLNFKIFSLNLPLSSFFSLTLHKESFTFFLYLKNSTVAIKTIIRF